MNLDKWIGPYKIMAFPWIDGKRIYFNVQEYRSGQSMSAPPLSDKTVYITDNDEGRRLLRDFTHSMAQYVSNMKMADHTEVTITA